MINERPGRTRRWCHEEVSCALVGRINERLGGTLIDEDELVRVEAMIRGEVLEPERAFLYRIVHNARNGIDVDKFDYLARDCRNTDVRVGCDFGRLIQSSRIEAGEICFIEREYHNMLQLFRSRLYMYREVYHDPRCKAAELMFGDALRAAEDTLGVMDAIDRGDCAAFLACTDALLGEIRRRALAEPALAAAGAIVRRIDMRDFYVHVGSLRLPTHARASDRYGRLFALTLPLGSFFFVCLSLALSLIFVPFWLLLFVIVAVIVVALSASVAFFFLFIPPFVLFVGPCVEPFSCAACRS
jgi:hypothetical protein